MPRQGLFPSQQFHCLSELITLQTNISLCGADMMGIVSLLHAFYYFISIGNRLLFLQFSNGVKSEQPKEIR
jgi:hypothetical protein